jgi:hypothetical protein
MIKYDLYEFLKEKVGNESKDLVTRLLGGTSGK